jgi:NAD(P)-dependent dehydrogenase (short-subunit alcohol dehydrogenase family)
MPKGIGKFTALTLAKQGADVAVTGWNHIQGAQAVADEIKAMGRKSMAVKMDASRYASVKEGFAAIKGTLGSVNIQ